MNPSWNEKNNLQTKTMESNETTITNYTIYIQLHVNVTLNKFIILKIKYYLF